MADAIEEKMVTKPRRAWLWLSLILLLGFGLRVAGLKWGQAYNYGSQGDSLEACEVAVNYGCDEPRAQYIGQPNYNPHAKLPGPLWAIFCYEGLRLGRGSVEGIIWPIIGLNTLAIYLVYLLVARTVGYRAALWAALLMATSPEVVQYSAIVFNPVVMPVLGTLLFLALWGVTQRSGSRGIFWVAFLLMVMPQFHMSGLMLFPAVAVVLLLARVRVNVLWLAAGFLLGGALYVPYLRGDFAHHWQNTRGMFTGDKKGFDPEAFKAFSAPFSFLVNVWSPTWAFTAEERRQMLRSCFGTYGLWLGAVGLSMIFSSILVVGAGLKIKGALRGIRESLRLVWSRSAGILFLTFLLVVPLVVGLANGKLFHGRYCLVLLGPLFGLCGAGVTAWLGMPRARRFVLPVIVLAISSNVWFVPMLYRAQGDMIQNGSRLIPSFFKLESVYQDLKVHAGADQPIIVEVDSYSKSLPRLDRPLHQAVLLRRYVASREKWNRAVDSQMPPREYRLCFADQVGPLDPSVGYLGNGVALIAENDLP